MLLTVLLWLSLRLSSLMLSLVCVFDVVRLDCFYVAFDVVVYSLLVVVVFAVLWFVVYCCLIFVVYCLLFIV